MKFSLPSNMVEFQTYSNSSPIAYDACFPSVTDTDVSVMHVTATKRPLRIHITLFQGDGRTLNLQ